MFDRTRILKLLFVKGRLNKQRIVTSLKTHPETARRELNSLIRENLVKEEGREGVKHPEHPGRPYFYSLTEEGKAAYISLVLGNLNNVLDIIRKISDEMLLFNPEKLEELRGALWRRSLSVPIDGNLPLEERVQQSSAAIIELYRPLVGSYRNIHDIVCRVMGEKRPQDLFIGLLPESTGGGLEFVSRAMLKQKGLSE